MYIGQVLKTGVASLALASLCITAWAAGNTNDLAALKSLSLEDLAAVQVDTVVGASKHEQKVTEAPSAVSIVTADDSKKQGYRTLGDVLRSVRGFYVTYDRGYNAIGMRGMNITGDFSGRRLITLDGHRLNDPIYDSAASGMDFILDVDLIERVEVTCCSSAAPKRSVSRQCCASSKATRCWVSAKSTALPSRAACKSAPSSSNWRAW